jgi:rRNA-processing protein CGR1
VKLSSVLGAAGGGGEGREVEHVPKKAGSKPWKVQRGQRTSAADRVHAPKGALAFHIAKTEGRLRKANKALSDAARAEREEKKREERERREANRKRREEAIAKSTTYQVLKDPSKIKKMTKKQLRQIKKTRINSRGVLEFVSPWAK